jgi:DNA recombination protein RmuC
MDAITAHSELINLAVMVLLLMLALALWLRQSKMLRQQELGHQGQARLEEMLREQERVLQRQLAEYRDSGHRDMHEQQRQLLLHLARMNQQLEKRFGEMQTGTADALGQGFQDVNRQLSEALQLNREELGKRFDSLTGSTDQRLKEISGQVEKRLDEGFRRTTETFTRVLEHLSRIDEAQKRITELSSNVVSLQEVLADKRSRGAFGEVQLTALIRSLLPENAFSLQHVLSTGVRADCMLFLPEPSGNIAVDAKFPLESYRSMTSTELPDVERERAASQFRQDIRKHINDIAGKYIIANETSDGAVMFIPSEPIFAEIHGHYPDLVEEAHNRRVWLVSPTTMMAILTTARAVLKDAATREQVHVIQLHLNSLSKDFGRFQERMERLSRHIHMAQKDVDEVNVSARKISSRFGQIEKVELDRLPEPGEAAITGAGAVAD